mgnify:CR=1 FL=1
MKDFKVINIEDSAIDAIKDFELPAKLPFGKFMSPIMAIANYQDGKWGELSLTKYRTLELDPTSKVLHYSQEIFEGMKAYHFDGKGPYLFRPQENLERFNFSARRMAMPEIPSEYFREALAAITSFSSSFIPQENEASLYLRPFMIGTEKGLGIKPSETFSFIVVASPSQAYFTSRSVKVQVEREAVRACPGGVGNAKTGGNYAASLQSMIKAKANGYDQVLWLDAVSKKNIEEMSGMNFFAVYGNELVTPKLTETILNGITRKSIITLAKHLGMKVREETMNINDLIKDIKSNKCTEVFACGTAVVITPISLLGEADQTHYTLSHEIGPVTTKLRNSLLGIQQGQEDDPFGWREEA